jgi:hypothetical protein
MMTKILEQIPTERNPRVDDGFQHIGDILPEVLNHIFQAAVDAQQRPTMEERGFPLRWAA